MRVLASLLVVLFAVTNLFALTINDKLSVSGLSFFRDRTDLKTTKVTDSKTVSSIDNYFLLIGRLGIDAQPTENASAHFLFNYSSPAGLINLPMLSNSNFSKIATPEEKPGLYLTNAYLQYKLEKLNMKVGMIKEKATLTRDNFYASIHKESKAYFYAVDEFFAVWMNNTIIGYMTNYKLADGYSLGLGISKSTENGFSETTEISDKTIDSLTVKNRDLINLHFNLPLKFGAVSVEPEGIIALDTTIQDIAAGLNVDVPVSALKGKLMLGGSLNSRKVLVDSDSSYNVNNILAKIGVSTTIIKTKNYKFAPKLFIAAAGQSATGLGDIKDDGLFTSFVDLQLINSYKGLIFRPRYRNYHEPNGAKKDGKNYTRQKFDFDLMVKF